MRPLRLFALDEEDLALVSAHLQDAIGRVGDMAFLPKERRFAVIFNRFDWAGVDADDGNGTGRSRARSYERRRTALHFERVLRAQVRGLPRTDKDALVNLLAIRFEPSDPPAGMIELVCSGDAAIRLDVECVEARMSDLGPAWATQARPDHHLDEDEAG
ncbi:MAG: DUF2948 family protein [Pseudomonadota bacterium]